MFSEKGNKNHEPGKTRINGRFYFFENIFIEPCVINNKNHSGCINEYDHCQKQQQYKQKFNRKYRKPVFSFFYFCCHSIKLNRPIRSLMQIIQCSHFSLSDLLLPCFRFASLSSQVYQLYLLTPKIFDSDRYRHSVFLTPY